MICPWLRPTCPQQLHRIVDFPVLKAMNYTDMSYEAGSYSHSKGDDCKRRGHTF